jgi:hypothetical protein
MAARSGRAPLLAGLLAAAAAVAAIGEPRTPAPADNANGTCITCHVGIEDIHPGFPLSCSDCHGGDATQTAKEQAHVLPALAVPTDERVLPRHHDLAWQRFRNPANLRVAAQVCGDCHGDLVAHLEKSLHGTTAGHLGDGFYEHGLTAGRRPTYSVFPVRDDDGRVPPGALYQTTQVPAPPRSGAKDRIETHYADLPRKACMHCHLWSEGRAIDGRLGMDGDYRGEGCAACHVTYADDGRSRSADPTIDKQEPGHPLAHRFTSAIPTETCTRCHYGDASIGLHYRGLAQLVPGQPAGPEVPGTTDSLQNGTFYVRDPDMTPPDVHHEKGLHCIDCHTLGDTMGDGNIWPQMDHAVEIECESCHGTFDRVTDLTTAHGRRVRNLLRDGDDVWLVSKVTGKRHRVTQVKHVVDPLHRDYDAAAAQAMTPAHRSLECYACHSAWNVNFFGFHFDRNEQFTQLDLLSGERTPGRVTTQEKVFATFNQLRLGYNHEGRIAPYMVGFSTIGSAHDKNGEILLWQATPETKAGLSGVTLVPHQPHSTRREGRTCTECHRSPATWGLGSANFRLAREYAFAVTARGLHTIALDTRTPGRTTPVAVLDIPGRPTALALRADPVHARASHAFVGCEDGTLAVVELRNPVMPKLLASRKLLADPRRMEVRADWLFVADGSGGLTVVDIARPAKPERAGGLPSVEARALAIAFPWLLLADGAGGLLIADVAEPARPRLLADVDVNGESSLPNEAFDVAVLFQYSRTRRAGEALQRSRARHLAYVACGLDGLRIVDFTEPTQPRLLERAGQQRARSDVRGVAINTVFDLGSAGGGLQSREREYLYAFIESGTDDQRQQAVVAVDVSDPRRPQPIRSGAARVYGGTGKLLVLRAYNPPFLEHHVLAAGAGGLGTLVDVGKTSAGVETAATWEGISGVRDLAIEEFAFDRLQDEAGRAHKDISHEGCRYLTREELLRVLRAPLPDADDPLGRYGEIEGYRPTSTGRRR